MLNRRSSILAMLLILLSILLLFSYGTPAWFGNVSWAIFPLTFNSGKGFGWVPSFMVLGTTFGVM